MSGARNLHRLAGTLQRLRHEAATGPCHFHPDRTAVGFIETWDLRHIGVCEACKTQGEGLGHTVHPDPLAPSGDTGKEAGDERGS